MKLFIAGHFLILSFIALGIGVWKDRIMLGGIIFLILQAIGIFIILKKDKGADDV